jgi:hypothetical protein
VQQQAPDLAGVHSVCGQAALPGIGVDEHCGAHVYQPVRRVRAVITFRLPLILDLVTNGMIRRTALFSLFFFHFLLLANPIVHLLVKNMERRQACKLSPWFELILLSHPLSSRLD